MWLPSVLMLQALQVLVAILSIDIIMYVFSFDLLENEL